MTGLTTEEWVERHREVEWVTKRVRLAFAPDHFNYAFLMNADPHVHPHVIPRYVATRELASVTFVDPDYPDSYRVPPSREKISQPEVIAAVEAGLRQS